MNRNKTELANFSKAQTYFGYTVGLFLMLYTLNKLLYELGDNLVLQAGLVAFNVFVLLVFISMGTFSIIKSYMVKEPFHPRRVLYLGGFLISLVIVYVLAQESYYRITFLSN